VPSESAKELRNLSKDELQLKEKTLREELFNLRFRLASGEIGDHARIGRAKKELARVCTVLKEKTDVKA
jgi:large subunit ribosomal protein L29